jgi:sporulation protein YqfC
MRKKEAKNKMVRKGLDGIGVSQDVALGVAIITVTGRRELVLENYKGILSYEEDQIQIQTREGKVCVSGKGLRVAYYTDEEMKLTGRIHQISYEV